MPAVNLSTFQDAADKKYGDFEITLPSGEEIAFIPVIRMEKERRKVVAAALDIPKRAAENAKAEAEGEENDDDLYEVYKDAFRLSERTEGDFTKLNSAVGDDPAVWQELFLAFNEDTQAGEA